MKTRILTVLLALPFVFAASGSAWAGTNITITPAALVVFNPADLTTAENNFEQYPNDFFTTNGTIIPSGLALVNTMGYPNGKSAIKQFPHFEVGAAAGLGVLQYTRMKDYSDTHPSVPGGGVNGGFHFGTGIFDDLDVTFKFFALGWFYSVDKSFEKSGTTTSYKVDISKTDIYSVGAKARYTLMERLTIVPLVFSFGGISINMAADYMKGKISSNMTIRDQRDVTFTYSGLLYTEPLQANYVSRGSIEWNLISFTPEILVYMDFFYFLSIYTGPGISLNYGSFNFMMDGTGDLQTTVTLPGTQIGTLISTTREKLKPAAMLPKWTLGIEFNILMVKLQIEGAAVLNSIKDSGTVQVGLRVQM